MPWKVEDGSSMAIVRRERQKTNGGQRAKIKGCERAGGRSSTGGKRHGEGRRTRGGRRTGEPLPAAEDLGKPAPAARDPVGRGKTGEPMPAPAPVLLSSWFDCWQAFVLAAACFRRCFFFFNHLFFS